MFVVRNAQAECYELNDRKHSWELVLPRWRHECFFTSLFKHLNSYVCEAHFTMPWNSVELQVL